MSKDLLAGFAGFLAARWGGDFCHSYRITRHTSWNRWRALGLKLGFKDADNVWHCSSIGQAADHYSWSGEDASAEYDDLSLRLQAAVRDEDEVKVRDVCFDILKWGGVWKGGKTSSVLWLNQQTKSGGLSGRLREACELLTGIEGDLDLFDGNSLLMNSSMTKLYAALNPSKLIIYDGRVGAALGLLSKEYLYSINYRGELPGDLKFLWGAAQSAQAVGQRNQRDPSDDDFCFPRLFGYRRDKLHAKMMRHTSSLLMKVASITGPSSQCDLARLEKALFMIGYDVSRSV